MDAARRLATPQSPGTKINTRYLMMIMAVLAVSNCYDGAALTELLSPRRIPWRPSTFKQAGMARYLRSRKGRSTWRPLFLALAVLAEGSQLTTWPYRSYRALHRAALRSATWACRMAACDGRAKR